MKISIVIPTLNEEVGLYHTLSCIPKFINEIIIVDGYSTDNTIQIARTFRTRVYFDDVGKGSALIKGMKKATGDIIIIADGDFAHDFKDIKKMVELLNDYDICMPSRFLKGGGSNDITFTRRLANFFIAKSINFIWNSGFTDVCYGFRAMKKDIVEILDLKSSGFEIETELSIKVAKKKIKYIEMPTFENKRKWGFGKLNTVKDGLRILNRIVVEMF